MTKNYYVVIIIAITTDFNKFALKNLLFLFIFLTAQFRGYLRLLFAIKINLQIFSYQSITTQ